MARSKNLRKRRKRKKKQKKFSLKRRPKRKLLRCRL